MIHTCKPNIHKWIGTVGKITHTRANLKAPQVAIVSDKLYLDSTILYSLFGKHSETCFTPR